MPLSPVALPYGVRHVQLTPYSDASALTLGTPIDLPNMQTLSFSEAEEFTDLRGDDKLVATHGQGASVEWELDAGGISLEAYKVLSGGTLVVDGTDATFGAFKRYDKMQSASRPYFKIEGKIISDSGGDVRVVIYRAKVNDTIEGEFADGEFYVTQASGIGLDNLSVTPPEETGLLYTIFQTEIGSPGTDVETPFAPVDTTP